ncbi:MAG: fasciclin domain-containing protein, partial [Pseudomonadota bacterium]
TGGGDPIALLTDILLYHVVPESLDSTEVLSATSIPTLLGETLGVDGLELVDNDPDIPNPELIETDILATNGIAHVLDGVLIPVDILNGDGGKGKVNFEIGGDGNDVFRTGANTDFVFGKDGSDFIRLGRGDDVGLGGAGNDNIRGGRGEDIVKGGDGNDTLGGGRDDDALYGGAGRDLLIGGRNDDLLTGGADADTFRFNAHSGHDTITDFMSGEDLIQIQVRKMRDFDDLEKRITNTEDGALIDLGRAEILLAGVDAATLSEDDFIFT